MKEIPLSKGFVAIVDDADYDYLNQWKWSYLEAGYAVRVVSRQKKQTMIYMHQLINHTPKDFHTDHINGDKLDNRRCNLRTATPSENGRNKCMQSNNTSGFRGVYWNKRRNKWMAAIHVCNKQIHIGYFLDPVEAAKAYDAAAIELHGDFSRPNALEGKRA